MVPGLTSLTLTALGLSNPYQGGYRDDKYRVQYEAGKWAEILLVTLRMFEVKSRGIGHAAYEITRTIDALIKNMPDLVTPEMKIARRETEELAKIAYERAWAEDSRIYLESAPGEFSSTSFQNSPSDTSLEKNGAPRASSPDGSRYPFSPGTSTTARNPSPSRSVPISNREPGGNLNLSLTQWRGSEAPEDARTLVASSSA
jgi:hypothetical protein